MILSGTLRRLRFICNRHAGNHASHATQVEDIIPLVLMVRLRTLFPFPALRSLRTRPGLEGTRAEGILFGSAAFPVPFAKIHPEIGLFCLR